MGRSGYRKRQYYFVPPYSLGGLIVYYSLGGLIVMYTPQIKFLLAFAFANFENWGETEILAFPVFPLVVSKFANEKARRNIFWGVYSCRLYGLRYSRCLTARKPKTFSMSRFKSKSRVTRQLFTERNPSLFMSDTDSQGDIITRLHQNGLLLVGHFDQRKFGAVFYQWICNLPYWPGKSSISNRQIRRDQQILRTLQFQVLKVK